MTGVDLRNVREANRALVLRTVHEYRRISRTELAQKLDLSLPAVSRIVKELSADGYLVETGYGNSSGGRKPVIIEPNPEAGTFLCVDCARSTIRTAAFDFSGEMISSAAYPIDQRNYLDAVLETCDICMSRQLPRILGLAVGVRGLIDVNAGVIRSSRNFRETDIPLRYILEQRYGVPVLLNMSARFAALAEWKLTYRQQIHNMVYLTTNWGLGSGIILGDNIFCGANGASGEVGEILIPQGEGFCSLESLCGGQALVHGAAQQWDTAEAARLRELAGSAEALSPQLVARCALEGDIFCQALVRRAVRFLGMGVVSIANTFDPELIVVGGVMAETGEAFLPSLRTMLDSSLPAAVASKIRLETSALGDDAALLGASTLLFRAAFQPAPERSGEWSVSL